MVYDIEFYVPGQMEYDLEIDAYSGAVLSYDYESLATNDDWDDYDDSWDDDYDDHDDYYDHDDYDDDYDD